MSSRPPSGGDVLDRLTRAEAALVVALDAGAVEGIEASVRDIATVLAEMRAVRDWQATPDTERAVRFALQLIDSAAARTNFLADQARRRLDLVMAARGHSPRIGYTRFAQGAA